MGILISYLNNLIAIQYIGKYAIQDEKIHRVQLSDLAQDGQIAHVNVNKLF